MAVKTELFGILNYTPDSFSDADQFNTPEKAILRAQELFDLGASYIDIGAESTRPGAKPLTPEQEWARLEEVLSRIVHAYPGHISLDTYHPETVRRVTAEIGPIIINDVTGFNSQSMIDVAAELELPCIVSHLPKKHGQDIQAAHNDAELIDNEDQVLHEIMTTRGRLISAGVKREMIILDPGLGFGKTRRTNWRLLEFAKLVPGIDVMIGYSRKGFLHTFPDVDTFNPELISLRDAARASTDPYSPEKTLYKERLDEIHAYVAKICIDSGAKYLRVHDVAEHRKYIALAA